MPKRNESIFPYDSDLKRELECCSTAAERQVVLASRKLPIITDDGRSSTTCTLPLDIYDKLSVMKISYRTLAYRRWYNEHRKA